MTASPISDLNPILMAVGAIVTIASKTGEAHFSFNYNFICSMVG